MSDHCAEMDEPYVPLRLIQGARGELEINVAGQRRYLTTAPDELIELTAFMKGRIHVAYCTSEADQVRLLREVQTMRNYSGVYQLVNGPIDPDLGYRYELNKWDFAHNGRATNADIRQLRAVFVDVDAIRKKGISSTNDQLREAQDIAHEIRDWFAGLLGDELPIGFGCSGNGAFVLLALEPIAPSDETTERISNLLGLLHKKFGNERIKIDSSVSNAARLMPCGGTWKRKGRDSEERPHRMTSFSCRAQVRRVPLEALC